MNKQHQGHRRPHPATTVLATALFVFAFLSCSAAQDIRGLEVCTAEKQVERRTSCLQSNIEFLQQSIVKLARETQEKIAATSRELASARAEIAASGRELASAKAEIAALKSKMEQLSSELARTKAAAESKGKK